MIQSSVGTLHLGRSPATLLDRVRTTRATASSGRRGLRRECHAITTRHGNSAGDYTSVRAKVLRLAAKPMVFRADWRGYAAAVSLSGTPSIWSQCRPAQNRHALLCRRVKPAIGDALKALERYVRIADEALVRIVQRSACRFGLSYGSAPAYEPSFAITLLRPSRQLVGRKIVPLRGEKRQTVTALRTLSAFDLI